MMSKTVHVVVSGRVQGGCFRYWTQQKAKGLGLVGWVRNLSDGDVEAVFSGVGGQVDAMLQMCRKGPRVAFVENMRINILDKPPEKSGFSVLATR